MWNDGGRLHHAKLPEQPLATLRIYVPGPHHHTATRLYLSAHIGKDMRESNLSSQETNELTVND